jgi:hypothetical protein
MVVSDHKLSTDRPWMKAVEMQWAALRKLEALGGRGARIAMRELRRAECFSWSGDTASAVNLASRTISGTNVFQRSQLPAPVAWWWFDSPIRFMGLSPEHDDFCHALLWGHDGTAVGIWAFIALETGPLPILALGMSEGLTIDGIQRRIQELGSHWRLSESQIGAGQAIARFILAGCAWLQQRIVIRSSGHIERHRRKQIAREYNVPPPSDVKVVQLRRIERHDDPSAEPAAVNYNWQWIVNGHWRNQAYRDHHNLIYILPYLKGPADKPLKVPKQTVYEVSR